MQFCFLSNPKGGVCFASDIVERSRKPDGFLRPFALSEAGFHLVDSSGSFVRTTVSEQCFNQSLLFIYGTIPGFRFLAFLINAFVNAISFHISRGTAHTFAKPAIISLSHVPVR